MLFQQQGLPVLCPCVKAAGQPRFWPMGGSSHPHTSARHASQSLLLAPVAGLEAGATALMSWMGGRSVAESQGVLHDL